MLVAVLLGELLASCSSSTSHYGRGPAAAAYVSLWQSRQWSKMEAMAVGRPAGLVKDQVAELTDLRVAGGHFRVSPAHQNRSSATVPVTARFAIPTLGPLTIHTTLRLRLYGRHWRVLWAPSTIDPLLFGGAHFAVNLDWAPRAPILAANGSGIEIGVQSSCIKSAAIAAARADPSVFEPVMQVSDVRYDQLRPSIYPVLGTVFRTTGGDIAPPASLAAVVGTLRTATKGELSTLGPPYASASIVGQGGIERPGKRRLPVGQASMVADDGPLLGAEPMRRAETEPVTGGALLPRGTTAWSS